MRKKVVGFGYGKDSTSAERRKKSSALQLRSFNECPAEYSFILKDVPDKSSYFCAKGGDNEASCLGDATQAYIQDREIWYLFSTLAYHNISSEANSCGSNKPVVLEYLGPYIRWIQNIIIST